MALFLVPTQQDRPHYRQNTSLDGVVYTLEFRWVQRWRVWTLSFLTADGTPLFRNKALVANVDLLARVRYKSDCPPGLLMVLDLQNQGGVPGLNDFHAEGAYVLSYLS